MYARKRSTRWPEFERRRRKPNGVVERQHDGDGAAGGEADGEGYGIGDAVFAGERTVSYADLAGDGDFDVNVSLEESDDERRRWTSGDGIERRRAVVAEHVGADGAVGEHGERLREGRGLRIEAVKTAARGGLTFFLFWL